MRTILAQRRPRRGAGRLVRGAGRAAAARLLAPERFGQTLRVSRAEKTVARTNEMPKVKAPKPTPKHLPLEAALKQVRFDEFFRSLQ
jgi:hypothetical protein